MVKKKSILKDALREISLNKKKFISLLLIIVIGTGFYVGLKSTPKDMKETAKAYYKETNLFDLKAVCIIRNTSLCKKIQRLNIHICLLDVFFNSRIHLLLTMSLKCIKNREIFGCYISNRTCDLTFTVLK